MHDYCHPITLECDTGRYWVKNYICILTKFYIFHDFFLIYILEEFVQIIIQIKF